MFLLSYAKADKENYVENVEKAFQARDRIIGYDCADFESDHSVVSLVHEESCSLKNGNFTTEKVNVRILQKKIYEAKPYIQCLISYDVTINHCGYMSDSFLKKYTFVDEVSYETCKNIHNRNFFVDPQRNWVTAAIVNNRGYFNGIIAGSLKGSRCKSSTFVDRDGITHEDVYVHQEIRIIINKASGDINTEDKVLILATGTRCDALKGSCFDSTWGVTYWDLDVSSNFCKKADSLLIIYEGPVNKTTEFKNNSTKISYYSTTEDRLFYIEASVPVSICSSPGYISQHPDIYITEDTRGPYFFKREKNFSIRNIDTLILHGFQLSMIYNDLTSQMTKLYETIQYQKCISDAKLIAATLSLAKHDPESLGLSIFGYNSGFMTKISSEAAYIVKCKPKTVQLRKTPLCYLELPVTYLNQSFFLTPRSRLLVQIGTEISCDDYFKPMFYIDRHWYTRQNGKFVEAVAPATMRIEKFHEWKVKSISGIAHKGIYSSEDIQSYKKSINEPLQQKALETNFYQAIRGESTLNPAFHVRNIITEKDFEAVFDIKEWSAKVFSAAYGSLLTLGHHFSAVIALVCILGILKFLIEWAINAYLIYNVFGWTWRIFFAFWKGIVDAFLHSAYNVNNVLNKAAEFDKKPVYESVKDKKAEANNIEIFIPTAPKAFNDYATEAKKLNIIS